MIKQKTLAIAVALAVVAGAFALALAIGPSSQGSGASVGESGTHESARNDQAACPEPDSCAEPGTTISALAAI